MQPLQVKSVRWQHLLNHRLQTLRPWMQKCISCVPANSPRALFTDGGSLACQSIIGKPTTPCPNRHTHPNTRYTQVNTHTHTRARAHTHTHTHVLFDRPLVASKTSSRPVNKYCAMAIYTHLFSRRRQLQTQP